MPEVLFSANLALDLWHAYTDSDVPRSSRSTGFAFVFVLENGGSTGYDGDVGVIGLAGSGEHELLGVGSCEAAT